LAPDDEKQLRLFHVTWQNPKPEIPIDSFDFISVREEFAAPFIIAVTAE
jgi:hypothetical protein